jgi:hypothetical protein
MVANRYLLEALEKLGAVEPLRKEFQAAWVADCTPMAKEQLAYAEARLLTVVDEVLFWSKRVVRFEAEASR